MPACLPTCKHFGPGRWRKIEFIERRCGGPECELRIDVVDVVQCRRVAVLRGIPVSRDAVRESRRGAVEALGHPRVVQEGAVREGCVGKWSDGRAAEFSASGTVITFKSTATWTAPTGATTVDYLVVAGGAGGGAGSAWVGSGMAPVGRSKVYARFGPAESVALISKT